MKKNTLLLLFFLKLSFLSFSQNFGQNQENNVLRIDYFQYDNGKHTFKVSNKVACETSVTVDKYDNNTTNHSIPANSFLLVDIIAPQTTIVKIKAKRISGSLCRSNPDNGWVEMESIIVLPVFFQTRFGYCLYPNKTMDFQFSVEQTSDVKQYYIKYSTDAKTFRYIQTVTPNKLVGPQTYKIRLK